LRAIESVPHLIAVRTIPIGLDAIVFPGAYLTLGASVVQEIRLMMVAIIVTGLILPSVAELCQPLCLILVKQGIVHHPRNMLELFLLFLFVFDH
jgi:hypothetical protein